MKKYKLLIDSPEYPKGTIATQITDSTYQLSIDGIPFNPVWFSVQIENRPEVWEEIVEQEEEQTEVQNEYLPFQPKEGELYWNVQLLGAIISGCANDSEGRHNVFRTEQAAQYEKLRQESMNNRWKPQTNEQYFYYIFKNSEADYDTWTNYETDLHRYFIGNVHRTRKEAEQWAEKYSEAWRVLL